MKEKLNKGKLNEDIRTVIDIDEESLYYAADETRNSIVPISSQA